MRIIKWFRRLLAQPAILLARFVSDPGSKARILKVAWGISHDGSAGVLYIGSLFRWGPELALMEGATLVRKYPSGEMAAVVGLAALDAPGDGLELAQEMLQIAQKQAPSHPMTRILEYTLRRRCSPSEQIALCEEFLGHHDLSPFFHRMVLVDHMWECLMAGKADVAEQQAKRVLAVEECGEAEMAMWAIREAQRDPTRARQHLKRAELLGKARVQYFRCMGHKAAGDTAAMRADLSELQQLDPRLAARCLHELGLTEAVQ